MRGGLNRRIAVTRHCCVVAIILVFELVGRSHPSACYHCALCWVRGIFIEELLYIVLESESDDLILDSPVNTQRRGMHHI